VRKNRPKCLPPNPPTMLVIFFDEVVRAATLTVDAIGIMDSDENIRDVGSKVVH
jgi:hypothetical protein